MNWADVLGNAINMFQHREKYAYFYGAKGQILTDAVMEALWKAEPGYFSRYTQKDKEAIFAFSRGKIGVDCSGFINLCCNQVNWSTGYYEESLNKTDPISGTWGNILYTTHGGKGRHVGLDAGEGKFLHAPRELTSIELGRIRDYDWEGSGQIRGVSYLLAGNR